MKKAIDKVKGIISQLEVVNDIKSNKNFSNAHYIDEKKDTLRFNYKNYSFYIDNNLKLSNEILIWESDGTHYHHKLQVIN